MALDLDIDIDIDIDIDLDAQYHEFHNDAIKI
jgi:hypothetical protein